MEETLGARLRAARRAAGFKTQKALGDAVGRSGKMIQNYENGSDIPPDILIALRKVIGPFDSGQDAVEAAVRRSELSEWRQTAVISVYQRNLDEQRREAAG